MVFEKLENENEEQFIFRIGQAKENGLIDASWSEIALIINKTFRESEDTWKHECVYRKAYATAKRFYDSGVFNISSNQQLQALFDQKEDIRRERIKLQTANIERNRYDREAARQALYYEYIGDVINALPLPEFEPIHIEKDESKKKYLTCLADLHYGARFHSENNEYSPDICRKRLITLAEELKEFATKKQINTLYIAELGDTIQGILRVSDLKLNDSSVVKAVVDVSRLLAQFLNELSRCVNIEYYHVGTANHSQTRPLGTKASQLADEDLEYVIGNYIQDLVRNNTHINVHLVENGKSYLDIDEIDTFNITIAHGHQIKNLESAVRDISMLRGEFIDYLVIGHYHDGKEFCAAEGKMHNMELLCCPSFVGSDPYSDSILKGSKPAVVTYGFDEKHGHTETYKIIFDKQ